tara:strand:+ start:58236 stop:59693 length:1458 start_codon:yes stop_codon:yes gene_type:complete
MTSDIDDNEEFDVADDFDSDFDTPEDMESSSQNPMTKLLIVGGVILVVIAAIFFFGGGDSSTPTSVVAGGQNDLREAPGTAELDPSMQEALEEINTDMQLAAEDDGGSFLPVPVSPTREQLPAEDLVPVEEDPLERWRKQQQEQLQLQAQQVPQAQVGPSPDEIARQQALQQLAQAMSSQMDEIVAAQQIQSLNSMTVTDVANPYAQTDANGVPLGVGGAVQGQAVPPSQVVEEVVQLIPAGTIEYGQTVLEANSDIGGPIMAQIVTGPFSGGRVIGTFDERNRYLVISFNTIVHQGVSYSIDAVAVDPNTTLTGMATDRDYRLFQRVILPAAARFVEGLGSAIADSGDTTVTVSGETVIQDENDLDTRQEVYNGVEEAARELGDFLDEEGNRVEVLIRVEAGTPIGVLFLAPVFDNNANTGQQAAQQENNLITPSIFNGNPQQQVLPFGLQQQAIPYYGGAPFYPQQANPAPTGTRTISTPSTQ